MPSKKKKDSKKLDLRDKAQQSAVAKEDGNDGKRSVENMAFEADEPSKDIEVQEEKLNTMRIELTKAMKEVQQCDQNLGQSSKEQDDPLDPPFVTPDESKESNRISFAWHDITIEAKSRKPMRSQGKLKSMVSHIQRRVCCSDPFDDVDDDSRANTPFNVEGGLSVDSGKKKRILQNVSGYAEPGELLAIMGSSGAGKTSLLNVLTFRNLHGFDFISGARYANGRRVTSNSLTALSSYIQQDDMFVGTLTVREQLHFQATLRMGSKIKNAERTSIVERVIQETGLSRCADTVIGYPGRLKGISGGETKRLSFACERLSDPALMFADEPTSGLDAFMALSVVKTMSKLARSGKTVIVTIHQPSSEVYSYFDKILFMANGQTAFFGRREEAIIFFEQLNHPCPVACNPADHIISVLSQKQSFSQREEMDELGFEDDDNETLSEWTTRTAEIAEQFRQSIYGQALSDRVDEHVTRESKTISEGDVEFGDALQTKRSPYKASWWTQFRTLLWRSSLTVIKDPLVLRVRAIQTMFIALLLGVVFWNQDYDSRGVANINGVMFLTLVNLTFQTTFSIVTVVSMEMPIMFREHFNGMYRISAYFVAKQVADIPLFLLVPTLFTAVFYYMVGLNPDPTRLAIYWAVNVVMTFVVVGFGHAVSSVSRNLPIAFSFIPPIVVPLMIFGGYYLNNASIPFWLDWLQYISWFRYTFEVMAVNQWSDVEIKCTLPSDIQNQPLIGNLTTLSAGDVAVRSVRCPFRDGRDVLDSLNYGDWTSVNFDFAMLAALLVGFRLIAYLSLVAKTWCHR